METGKKLYSELGCIQCHRLGDEGGGAGPDLSNLATKSTPTQIVQSIIEPSATIAPEFALTKVATLDGRSVTGRIEFEDDAVIRLRSPESFDTPITIQKSEIEQRVLSNVSMMPIDILNGCSEEEILDLLFFLTSPTHGENIRSSTVD